MQSEIERTRLILYRSNTIRHIFLSREEIVRETYITYTIKPEYECKHKYDFT